MNRSYTRDYYLGRVEQLRGVRSDMAITSDIIVGFPGEEQSDFEATIGLVRNVEFDSLFMFKYSDRPNVPAVKFSNKVPEALKVERFDTLLKVQSGYTRKKNEALVGTIQEILVEGLSKKSPDRLTGRTPCNRVVNFADDKARAGDMLPVRIVEAFPNSLRGRPVGKGKGENTGQNGGLSHAA